MNGARKGERGGSTIMDLISAMVVAPFVFPPEALVHSSRRHMELLKKLHMELLKKWSQFQRRPPAPVGHQGRRPIGLPIDLPALDGRARRARRTALTARTLLTPSPRRRHQLPPLTGAIARIITSRNERAAIERDNVKCSIALTSLEGAALVGRAAVASVLPVFARARNANPVVMRRLARGVALGLIGRAVVCDNVATVVHRVLDIAVQAFNLSGRTGFAAWPGLAARSVSRLTNLREDIRLDGWPLDPRHPVNRIR
jgi:hypothetical protein